MNTVKTARMKTLNAAFLLEKESVDVAAFQEVSALASDDFPFAFDQLQSTTFRFATLNTDGGGLEYGAFVWNESTTEAIGGPVLMESVPLRRKPLAMRFRHRETETNFVFVSVHLRSELKHGLDEAAAIAESLVSFIKSKGWGDAASVVLLGDFNFAPPCGWLKLKNKAKERLGLA